MSRYLVCLWFLILTASAKAQKLQPFIESVGFAEKIVVKGFKGELEIIPVQSETLRVEAQKQGSGGPFDQWTYTVRKKSRSVEVVIKGPSDQEDWNKLQAGKIPGFKMKIMAPLKPLEVSWASGKVSTSGWVSDLSVQMTEGQFSSTKGKGRLKIQMVQGQVSVAQHDGQIDLQTFKGVSKVSGSKGALNLSNHSAKYQIDKHQGPVDLTNHSGTLQLRKVIGRSKMKNISGAILVRDFDGSLQGDFLKGSLDIKVAKLHDFVVNSDEANITLDAPKDSGAVVELRSEKGDLWAPIHLRKIKKGRWTERRGRLKGDEQGNIKIISKYGNIVLK